MAKASGRHKVIGGKRFFRYRVGLSHDAAKKMAKDLRETGRYFVRIQRHEGDWAVYCRDKK